VQTFRCPVTRSSVDRADESGLLQVRLMYVLPSDLPDESLDVNGRICNSAKAFSGWLGTQLGGRTLRFDTGGGELDIGFVRLTKTNVQMRGSGNANDVNTGVAYVRERIERELIAQNQVKPDKLYAVFYGGESTYACGGAAYPPALIGSVIAMYLKSAIAGVACEARPWGHRAELRAAHHESRSAAHGHELGARLGLGSDDSRRGGQVDREPFGVEAEVELVFPAEFESRGRGRRRGGVRAFIGVAFGEVGGVGGELVGDDADFDVVARRAGRDAPSA
jgi:hypothetical protein